MTDVRMELSTHDEDLLELGMGWLEGDLDSAEVALTTVLKACRDAEQLGLRRLQRLTIRDGGLLDFGRDHAWAFYACYAKKKDETPVAGGAVLQEGVRMTVAIDT